MLGIAAGRGRMQMQLAEAAAERLVLLMGQRLVAKEDHQIIHQGIVDFLEGLVAEGLGKIDARDFRTDCRRELSHFDGLVSHLLFPTYQASLREKATMSDTLVLRAATAADAAT